MSEANIIERRTELHPERRTDADNLEVWSVKWTRPSSRGGRPVKTGSVLMTIKASAEACYDRQEAKGFEPTLVQSFISGWV